MYPLWLWASKKKISTRTYHSESLNPLWPFPPLSGLFNGHVSCHWPLTYRGRIIREIEEGRGQAMNKIIVSVRLGRDPEMRYLPSGGGVDRDTVFIEFGIRL